MTRWLKAARAEAVRDIKLSLRYPIQIVTGIIILYVLFMGIFTGAAMLAGGGQAKEFGSSLDALVIGYCMWYFAVLAINSMSVDIENEARQGTLEQRLRALLGAIAEVYASVLSPDPIINPIISST